MKKISSDENLFIAECAKCDEWYRKMFENSLACFYE